MAESLITIQVKQPEVDGLNWLFVERSGGRSVFFLLTLSHHLVSKVEREERRNFFLNVFGDLKVRENDDTCEETPPTAPGVLGMNTHSISSNLQI